MTNLDYLIKMILDDPSDKDTRFVISDLLEEQGNTKAKLVREKGIWAVFPCFGDPNDCNLFWINDLWTVSDGQSVMISRINPPLLVPRCYIDIADNTHPATYSYGKLWYCHKDYPPYKDK